MCMYLVLYKPEIFLPGGNFHQSLHLFCPMTFIMLAKIIYFAKSFSNAVVVWVGRILSGEKVSTIIILCCLQNVTISLMPTHRLQVKLQAKCWVREGLGREGLNQVLSSHQRRVTSLHSYLLLVVPFIQSVELILWTCSPWQYQISTSAMHWREALRQQQQLTARLWDAHWELCKCCWADCMLTGRWVYTMYDLEVFEVIAVSIRILK